MSPRPEDPAAFLAALLDPALPAPPQIARQAGASAQARFAVYRNNVTVALVDALQARFAVTTRLVGEPFFRAMARDYARLDPPRSPALGDYGDGLPEFIRAFAPASGLPYLADVAALEAAWSQSWSEAESAVLEPAELAQWSPEDLLASRARLHPALRLLRSAHPVGSLWSAHQSEGPVSAPQTWAAEDVLVTRPEAQVLVRVLPEGDFAFIHALTAGNTLELAFDAGAREAAQFDPGNALLGLVQAGGITTLELQ